MGRHCSVLERKSSRFFIAVNKIDIFVDIFSVQSKPCVNKWRLFIVCSREWDIVLLSLNDSNELHPINSIIVERVNTLMKYQFYFNANLINGISQLHPHFCNNFIIYQHVYLKLKKSWILKRDHLLFDILSLIKRHPGFSLLKIKISNTLPLVNIKCNLGVTCEAGKPHYLTFIETPKVISL